MAHIISICSEKGGVGKTTSTVNIAGGLAKLGKKVLVIDLDQQCNASRALGYIKDSKLTVSEVIYNICADIKTDYINTIRHNDFGIDYVPASPMLTNITTFMASNSDSNYILKKAVINNVYSQYDFIIIDCRTLLDLLVSNAMNASDFVIIPVECGLFSFDGLTKMINKVISINNSTNRNLKILGLLLNKYVRTNVSLSIADSVKEEYNQLVFDTIVPFCPAQSEMAVMQQKICVNETNSSLGSAFNEISKEIIKRIESVSI